MIMIKINKDFNLRIISLSLITGLFFFNALAYGVTLSEKTHLRKPLLFNKDVSRNEALDRGQKIASTLTLPFQIVDSEEIKRRFDTRKTSESNILIGFMRDSEDRIQPVFSNSPEFQSTRELELQMGIVLFGTGWNPGREAREIPLTILGKKEGVHLTKLDKTNDWLMLPDEIKEIFNNGNILVTSFSKLDNGYSVLMAVTPGNQRDRSEGRTGVLLKDGVPIIIKIKDKEFIVEIKGVGNAEGGFDADYEVLRGGAQIEESEREFNNLETKRKIGKEFNQGETVRAVAHIDFRIDGREQGYLIRLSPGSVRATYNKNVAFKTLERAERVKKVAYSMGKQMAEFFSEGLIPYSHPENLIAVDTERNFIFTDYSDIRPINTFPTEIEGHRHDLYGVIKHSLNTVTEISGYKEYDGFKNFKQGLADGLEEAGKIYRDEKSKLIGLGKFEKIRDFLWKSFFAADYYKARKIYGWTPTFFRHLQDSVDTKFISKIVEEAIKKHSDNDIEIFRMKDVQEKEKYRRENKLLESTGFTAEGIIAITNSDEARRHSKKGMETLGAMDIWGAKYYVIWDLWGDNFSDLKLVAEHLKKEAEFLETVLDSINADLFDDVNKNLKIARGRLNVLRKLTPYDYYRKLLENPQYSRDMAMLPYFSKPISKDKVNIRDEIRNIVNNRVDI